MDDTAAVRGCECVRNLQTDQQCRLQFQRATGDELAYVLAFDELHCNEVNAVYFVEIEDGADVWMVERRGETCFAFKSFKVGFFRAELGRDDLDHDRASEFGVDGFVNCALPADTE